MLLQVLWVKPNTLCIRNTSIMLCASLKREKKKFFLILNKWFLLNAKLTTTFNYKSTLSLMKLVQKMALDFSR